MELTDLLTSLDSLLFPLITEGSERPVVREDFSSKIITWEETLTRLSVIVQESANFDKDNKDLRKLLDTSACLSILAACQFSEENVWTNSNLREKSLQVQSIVCSLSGYRSINEALISNKGQLFVSALIKLRAVLTPQDWKRFPTAVFCYYWLITKVESPDLGPHLDLVLPTALLIVDDFVVQNQCRGFLCLSHIIENTASSELSCRGVDGVIYNVLEKAFYRNEPEIIEPAGTCCLQLLRKTNSQSLYSSSEWSKYDDFLEIIIKNMRLEQRLDLREVYIKILPHFVSSMGLSTCRFLPSLLEVFDEYLIEPTSSIDALKALNVLLKVTWPTIQFYERKLTNSLLKTLYDSTSSQTRHPSQLVGDLVAFIRELVLVFMCQELKTASFPTSNVKFLESIREINQISLSKVSNSKS